MTIDKYRNVSFNIFAINYDELQSAFEKIGFVIVMSDEKNGILSLKMIKNFKAGSKLSGLKSLPNGLFGMGLQVRSLFFLPNTQDIFTFYLQNNPWYTFFPLKNNVCFFLFEKEHNPERLNQLKAYKYSELFSS